MLPKLTEILYLFIYFLICSMYWYQRPSVCTVKSGSPLPEPQGSLHQLHLRGWQSGTDMVTGRTFGPEFFATHTRGDRICFDYSRGRKQNRVTSTANHSRPNSVQIGCQRRRIFAIGHVIKNEQSRTTSSQRYFLFLLFSNLYGFFTMHFFYFRHISWQCRYDR